MHILKNPIPITMLQAIHEGQDCKQYQRAMLNESQDENSIKTKKWIEVSEFVWHFLSPTLYLPA